MVCRALAWIVDHLNEFDTFKEGRPFEIKHGQRVGELAILVHSYVALTSDREGEKVRKIVAFLGAIQRNRQFADRLLRSPAEFVLFAEVYACLRAVGQDDLNQRKLIERVLDIRFLEHTERLPHRMMDISNCLEWGDFYHPFPSLESLYATSILAQIPCPLFLDEDAVYAITHVIMFLYGFGTRKTISIPVEQIEPLRRALSVLLVACCLEHHWDLLAELLLCWECIGLEACVVYEKAWDAFLGAQNDDGAVPGPEWAQRLHNVVDERLDAQKEQDFYFSHHYHTTLVGIIAGSLHLNRYKDRVSGPEPEAVIVGTENNVKEARDLYNRPPSESSSKPGTLEPIRNARRWLEQMSVSTLQDGRPDAQVMCRMLLGCWLCDSLTGNIEEAFSGAAQRIGGALAARDLEGSLDWSTTQPALKLIVAGILSPHEVFIPSLHSTDGFLFQAAALLRDVPVQDAMADMPLCEKRVLLYRMGLHPIPTRVDVSEVMTFAQTLSLSEYLPAIDDLLLRIHSYAAFGTRNVELALGDPEIGEMLSGVAMSLLRTYDLVTGCRMLRAVRYLGVGGEIFDACVSFLFLQQRLEGSFGFFGTEERRLAKTTLQTFSADLDIYLPVTIECLWALGEGCNPEWRLYNTLPRVDRLRC